jgi:hypothetical protein
LKAHGCAKAIGKAWTAPRTERAQWKALPGGLTKLVDDRCGAKEVARRLRPAERMIPPRYRR